MDPIRLAAKILWLKRNEPETLVRRAKFALLKDYLVYRLTGRLVSEDSLLCATILWDISGDGSAQYIAVLGDGRLSAAPGAGGQWPARQCAYGYTGGVRLDLVPGVALRFPTERDDLRDFDFDTETGDGVDHAPQHDGETFHDDSGDVLLLVCESQPEDHSAGVGG